ncbi:MAG TPA: hypothetical protein VMR70_04225 [Flavisolibacter sp.]|nr:hypothetical protein [Flavisolibacter sp.]
MKKLFFVVLAAGTLVACDNSAADAEKRAKDSLDSVTNLQKESIDNAAQDAKQGLDSTTDAAKDSLDAATKSADSTTKAQ